MAFVLKSFRLPEEYVALVEELAGKDDESEGYVIPQAIYGMWNESLPPPRRRDSRARSGDAAAVQVQVAGGVEIVDRGANGSGDQ